MVKVKKESMHMPVLSGPATVLPAFPLPDYNFINDLSAGSPTETLLRLLLPLNDQV
jgi:hypothetical protein